MSTPVQLIGSKEIPIARGALGLEVVGVTGGSTPVVVAGPPAPGTLLTVSQVVQFSVTSPSSTPFRALLLLAQYPTLGIYEVAHDGSGFSSNYTGTRTAIPGGFDFANLIRVGGWPSAPTFVVFAVDVNGKENS